jgi:hypothetical protein
MLIRVATSFVTAIVVFMMSPPKGLLFVPYTMKTIPLIETDRSSKKREISPPDPLKRKEKPRQVRENLCGPVRGCYECMVRRVGPIATASALPI